ncbi:chromosome partitioning protein [Marinospirillum celere]|uniref:Chromosome partitioning protein n=1 Tax=Marinospirillum celere TaxID=1122252 RepID=A0A1I1HX02_9GAMM|nr:ParA family protein [Marinospirillum celere]SFC28474.1 chromosome partitioning protein [Marinospirillum celere]
MRRVVFNQKGGVGKSSITCNLASISAASGQPTLVIDLDPQGNSTHYLTGQPAQDLDDSMFDFFEQSLTLGGGRKSLADLVQPTPYENLYVLAAHPELESLEAKLESRYKIYKLKEALLELTDLYPQIWIDTPPALNFFSRSALIAAETCLIPFDCDAFSRQALYSLKEAIDELRADHNDALQIEGIIVNQFNAQARLPRVLIEELLAEEHPVLPVHLSSSVKMRESHQVSRPLNHYAPKHKLTQQFQELFELLHG